MRFWSRAMYAIRTGAMAATRAFSDPGQTERELTQAELVARYNLRWAYYQNSMFDRAVKGWEDYKRRYNLYRNIRLPYNPTFRLTEFYTGKVYPGLLSRDGLPLPDGIPLAFPFSKNTQEALQVAVAQIWQWSNWQAKKALEVRHGAALGDAFVEIIDDLEHRKVYLDIVWPGKVCEVVQDSAGNVKSYVIAYMVRDKETRQTYQYRKEVDGQAFRYFKDGEPFDYGQGAIVENPYGFAPAVWCKHLDMGEERGEPANFSSLPKVDELNNLISHVHDQIHKVIGAPLVFFGSGPINNLLSTTKRGSSADEFDPTTAAQLEQEKVRLLKGPSDGHVEKLAGDLDLAGTIQYAQGLVEEIEQDHPELVFYKELRGMSQLTGPAAERLVGDVAGKIVEAQAMYDLANIKAFQMAVAIAGFRAKSGAWGQLNSQQAKFLPYDLMSYERGDLTMELMPRPILTSTLKEKAEERQAFWNGIGAAVQQAGVPVQVALRDAGWSEGQLLELTNTQARKIQEDQLLAQEDVIPAQGQ